ncbi:MAG: M16 family metallopeptidase [Candidatus Saccharimonadales bacterium]
MKHSVTEIKLKNGAKGLVIHVPDASVMTYDINFRAGEYLVKPDKWEVPHLMEHVLLGANELIPKARDFHAELEKNGAYSNASTGVYDITYEAECAEFEWLRVLNLMVIAIAKPLFLEDEFKAEFGNVQEEMTARANNHFRRLSLEMRKAIGFIAKTDGERLNLMHNVTVDDVREHHKKTHFTANMRFVVAGNFTPGRMKALTSCLESIELPRGSKRFTLPNEKPKNLDKPLYVRNDTVENLYFYIDTFKCSRLKDNEADALNLLNTYLTETLYSKILGTARERGLLYDMNSGLSQTKDASNWWFGGQVSEKNSKALADIFISELSKVCRADLKQDDIDATKQYALGRFQRSAQTVGGTANGYSNRYFFDGIVEVYYKIPERINSVNKEEMVKVANMMFDEKLWILGVLGNCGQQLVDDLYRQLSVLW